jgi:hypothetical protein
VFEALATTLMSQAGRKRRAEGREVLRLLDSTSITLKGRGFDEWVRHTRNKNNRGIKVHVLFGAKEQVPLSAATSAATVNDLEYGREMELESGVIYVFDKGYCDYSWWWRIAKSKSRFVTRFKSNARLAVVKRRKIAKNARGTILKDRWVKFANKNPGGGRRNPYTKTLRYIEVSRKEQKQPPLVLATNDLKSSALKIAERYQQRWQIELFFKWIKQHLRIKRFVGKSYAAVRIQIFTALIAYLLLALYAKAHNIKKSLWLLAAEFRSTLFQRASEEWSRHRRWRDQRSDFESRQMQVFA